MKIYSNLDLIGGGKREPVPFSQLSPSDFSTAFAENCINQCYFIAGILIIKKIVGEKNFPVGVSLATGSAVFYAMGAGLGLYFARSNSESSRRIA